MAEDWDQQFPVFGESLSVLRQLVEDASADRLRHIGRPRTPPRIKPRGPSVVFSTIHPSENSPTG